MKRYIPQFKEKDFFKKPESDLSDTDFAIILPDGTRLFRMDTPEDAQTSVNKLALNLSKEQFEMAMKKLKMKYPGISPEEKDKPKEEK